MKKNKYLIAGLTLGVFLGVGGFYFQKNSIEKKYSQLEAEKNLHKKLVEEFYQANIAKFNYVENIMKNSIGVNGIKYDLEKLKSIQLNSQDDFDQYEQIYSRVNQGLGIESVKITDNKGNLFKTESQLRKMEQFDLAIDLSRKRLSEFSFEWNLKKSLQEKKWLSSQNLQSLPIFRVDEMILAKKKTQN